MTNRNHSTTVKCLSTNGSLFCINKNEFISKFCRDDKTWKLLGEMSVVMDIKSKSKVRQAKKSTDFNFVSSLNNSVEEDQSLDSRHSEQSREDLGSSKETIDMYTKNLKFPVIIKKYNLKLTKDRLDDWRRTMKIIVDCKNGVYPQDKYEDRIPMYRCIQNPINITPLKQRSNDPLAQLNRHSFSHRSTNPHQTSQGVVS